MIEIIIMIILVLGIIGFTVYFFIDYYNHKKDNTKSFDTVDTNLKAEKTDRLGNLKYVVDQVNKTNETMDADYLKRFDTIEDNVESHINKYNAFESGFGSIIRTRNASSNVTLQVTQLANLPATDVDLIKHVSFLSGATIKDLVADPANPNQRFKVCGAGSTGRCIELPNSEGDTYLTSLDGTKSIVFDAPVKAYNSIDLYNNVGTGTTASPTMSLRSGINNSTHFDLAMDGSMVVKSMLEDNTTAELLKVDKASTTVKNNLVIENGTVGIGTIRYNNEGIVIEPGVGKNVIINGNIKVIGNVESTNPVGIATIATTDTTMLIA
jgi:hypothetical protein